MTSPWAFVAISHHGIKLTVLCRYEQKHALLLLYYFRYVLHVAFVWLIQSTAGFNIQDSLYVHLFETYLHYYLPICGSVPIFQKMLQLKDNQPKFGYKQPGNNIGLSYQTSHNSEEVFLGQ